MVRSRLIETDRVLAELAQGSDRAVALVGGSLVEHTLFSALCRKLGLAEGSLVELHLLDTPVMRRPVAAIYRSDTPLSAPATAFLELARGLAGGGKSSESPA